MPDKKFRMIRFLLLLFLCIVLFVFTVNQANADTGSISGKVINAFGTAVPIVSVSVYDINGNPPIPVPTASTAQDGTFTINGLPTGSYRIRFDPVTIMGYFSQWYNNKVDINSADLIFVTAPNTTILSNTVLASGGILSGKVTNAAGTGIAGIEVNYSNSSNFGGGATTAQDGSYTIIGLPTDTYKIKFDSSQSDTGYLSQWYNNKSDQSSADPISITSPNTTIINATLAAGGTISGKVTNAEGTGIAYVGLSAHNESNIALWDAEVDPGNRTVV